MSRDHRNHIEATNYYPTADDLAEWNNYLDMCERNDIARMEEEQQEIYQQNSIADLEAQIYVEQTEIGTSSTEPRPQSQPAN